MKINFTIFISVVYLLFSLTTSIVSDASVHQIVSEVEDSAPKTEGVEEASLHCIIHSSKKNNSSKSRRHIKVYQTNDTNWNIYQNPVTTSTTKSFFSSGDSDKNPIYIKNQAFII